MTVCDTEKSEQYTPVNLSTPETEKTHENDEDWLHKTPHQENLHRYLLIGIFTGLFTLLLISGVSAFTVTTLATRLKKPCPALPMCPMVTCPDGWVGYQGKCYYFAKAERNWTSSKMHCSSLNASLAVIDSQEEMDFIRRYKGPVDHWIGLQRNLSQPWKWINGTTFNNWFTILGGGNYAYMNEKSFASSDSSREEPWICSKLAVT